MWQRASGALLRRLRPCHALRARAAHRRFHPLPRMSTPQHRPWWMSAFAARATENTPSSSPGGGRDAAREPLPAWPVDGIEFNARLPDGGHGERIAREAAQQTAAAAANASHHEEAGEMAEGHALVAAVLTPHEREAVTRVATTTEAGRNAVARGGWVCAQCLTPMPFRARSICDGCRALRHDAAVTVQRWRSDAENWTCGLCHEFNYPHDNVCRCCATARAECREVRAVHHERVADEIRHAAVGSVINTRNRVCRWQCGGCGEINSLQCSQCRNCGGERFAMTVSCPHCQSAHTLSNARMYGSEVQDRRHVTQAFGTHNCSPRLAPTQTCAHCTAPLHGAAVTSLSRAAWLCACGGVNTGSQVSCARCRLPRAIPSAATLRRLLAPAIQQTIMGTRQQQRSVSGDSPGRPSGGSGGGNDVGTTAASAAWDFVNCTNWFCESCLDGCVNTASHYVVTLSSGRGRGGSGGGLAGGNGKIARLVRGEARCRGCGTPWHHQQLRDEDQCWRCACHMTNQRSDEKCHSCGLPAKDGIRVDVLSQWTRGDWLCTACGRHNYRDRVQCSCGQTRRS